jgi:leucyl-tRNA synthetase
MKTEMETTIIELPYEIGQEAFYLKDNQLKSGKIWRIDAEVTENEIRFSIWFKLEDYKSELISSYYVFSTKEEAIDYVTSQLK